MTTWTQINTATTTAAYDFSTYGSFAFAEDCFADGAVNEAWNLINTTQSPNWTQVSTGAISVAYDFDTYGTLSFCEGTFADGAINEPWTLVPTV
jgi:hypothetical protein